MTTFTVFTDDDQFKIKAEAGVPMGDFYAFFDTCGTVTTKRVGLFRKRDVEVHGTGRDYRELVRLSSIQRIVITPSPAAEEPSRGNNRDGQIR